MYSFREASAILGISGVIINPPPANVLPAQKPSKFTNKLIIEENISISTTKENLKNNARSDSLISSLLTFQMEFQISSHDHPFASSILDAQWLTKGPRPSSFFDHHHINNSYPITSFSSNLEENIKWAESRNVIELTLSIKNSGIVYSPGDSIGIFAPNPIDIVVETINRLKQSTHHITINKTNNDNNSDNQSQQSHQLSQDTVLYTSCLPSGFVPTGTTHITLGELLTKKVDLTGPLRKLALLPLIDYCSDANDKIILQWLCSKGDVGKKLWSEIIEKQYIGITEFLRILPSCQPPLAVFLSCCTSTRPRYYSICSSPLLRPDSVSVALSLERYLGTFGCSPTVLAAVSSSSSTAVDKDISEDNFLNMNSASDISTNRMYITRRVGLCTNYLFTLSQPWLLPQQSQSSHAELSLPPSTTVLSPLISDNNNSGNTSENVNISRGNIHNNNSNSICNSTANNIRIFHKPTLTFHMPSNISFPLILIGPGTGVAPFIGFLENRLAMLLQKQWMIKGGKGGGGGSSGGSGGKGQSLTSMSGSEHTVSIIPPAVSSTSSINNNSSIHSTRVPSPALPPYSSTTSSSSTSYLSQGKEISCGTWHGCFELDDNDLPAESTKVESFIESIPSGPIHLFFGCRNQEDYLFEQVLDMYRNERILTTLEVAMSRVTVVPPPPVDDITVIVFSNDNNSNSGNNIKSGDGCESSTQIVLENGTSCNSSNGHSTTNGKTLDDSQDSSENVRTDTSSNTISASGNSNTNSHKNGDDGHKNESSNISNRNINSSITGTDSFAGIHSNTTNITTIPTTKSKKEYVTDRIRLRGVELIDLICTKNACIYICGDGNAMAKDVYKLFIELLQRYGIPNTSKITPITTSLSQSNLSTATTATAATATTPSTTATATTTSTTPSQSSSGGVSDSKSVVGMSEEEAKEYIQDLKLRRRYLLDIWA